MSNSTVHFKSPTFFAKILELVLAAIATGIFMAENSFLLTYRSKWAVMFGTLIGFIMISIIIIITTVLNNPLHKAVLLMVSLAAAVMFFATGGIMFELYHNSSRASGLLIGSGMFAFLNGIVYLVDGGITLKYG